MVTMVRERRAPLRNCGPAVSVTDSRLLACLRIDVVAVESAESVSV